MFEELSSHHCAYGMQAHVLGPASAMAVAVEAGDRVVTARCKWGTADVALGHETSLSDGGHKPLGTPPFIFEHSFDTL
jgi:hypothetical protein